MKYLLTFILSFWACFSALGSPLDKLTDEQVKNINEGQILMLEKPRSELPWPKVDAHLKLDVEALDGLAVFAAFDAQKDYVPNLIESTPFKVDGHSKVFVRYEMKLPWPIPNNRYVHGHEFKKHGSNDYEISWWMVESNSAESVEGSARFYRVDDQTYMYYQSLIVPLSLFASFIKGSMLSDVRATLEAIRKSTHDYAQNHTAFMQEYRELLEQTFQKKAAWKQKLPKSKGPTPGDSNKVD